MDDPRSITTLGWREWLALPEFAIACIEARVDARAAVSRLHAVDLRPVEVDGEPGLEFRVYPLRGDRRTSVAAVARRAARRGAVRTLATLGTATWPLELELVEAEPGGFPLLLAAAAIGLAVDVDPGRSFLAGPPAVGPWPPARPEELPAMV